MNKGEKIPRPCLICKKDIFYLWEKDIAPEATNLDNASDIIINSWYGSRFDMTEHLANICDDCMEQAIDDGRVTLYNIKGPFG